MEKSDGCDIAVVGLTAHLRGCADSLTLLSIKSIISQLIQDIIDAIDSSEVNLEWRVLLLPWKNLTLVLSLRPSIANEFYSRSLPFETLSSSRHP